MNKPGTIEIIQTEEACENCSYFVIEYFEIKEDGEYKVMYEHVMTSWDLQYAFKHLNLGLNYTSVFEQSVKLEYLEFISWCRLMKRLIGVRQDTYFIQEEQFNEFSEKLRRKIQIGVLITRNAF